MSTTARCLLALLLAMFSPLTALADKVRDIRLAVQTPVLSPGGILFLPLTAEQPGDRWPDTLTLTLHNNRVVSARVLWIHPAHPPLIRRWTDDPLNLAVRCIVPDDDSSLPLTGSPFLLAELPANAAGDIRFGPQRITPLWRTLPPSGETLNPALLRTQADDRPDPDSPFEYWRWVLLARRLDLRPPPAEHYGDPGSLVARAITQAWSVGLARLDDIDPHLAGECGWRLTNTARDNEREFAAWVAAPDRVAQLQSILLNFELADHELLLATRAWLEAVSTYFFWPELESQHAVRVATVNPTRQPIAVTLRWESAENVEIPIAVRLDPGVLTPITLRRPEQPRMIADADGRLHATRESLTLSSVRGDAQITFDPRSLSVRPPGAFLRPPAPPLTLDDTWRSRQRAVPDDFATAVQVRRLHRRWEVFFECRVPIELPADAAENASPARDSVTLALALADPIDETIDDPEHLVAPPVPHVILTIPREGFWSFSRGSNDGTLQIHRSGDRFADRWYCRVVLPDAWLSPDPNTPTLIRCLRSHDGSPAIETSPGVTAPWRSSETFVPLDLTVWDDLP